MRVLSIDPGLRATGWASWVDAELRDCGIARCLAGRGATAWKEIGDQFRGWETDLLLYERMVVHATRVDAGNDLLELSGVTGAIAQAVTFERTLDLSPAEWKGNTPKDVSHRRMWLALTEREAALVRSVTEELPSSLVHNMYDAVALGLSQRARGVL